MSYTTPRDTTGLVGVVGAFPGLNSVAEAQCEREWVDRVFCGYDDPEILPTGENPAMSQRR